MKRKNLVKVISVLFALVGVLGFIGGIIAFSSGYSMNANYGGGWLNFGPAFMSFGALFSLFSLYIVAVSSGLNKLQYWAYKAALGVLGSISLLAWVFISNKVSSVIVIAINVIAGAILFTNKKLFIDRKSVMNFGFLKSVTGATHENKL